MRKAVSVFELLHYLKGQLDYDNNIQNIIVSGEISNFTHHSSGHLYFSLKDDKARINCVMFKGNTYNLLFKPKNGDKVLVKAKTSIFEASGQLQLYIQEMKIDGIGELYLKYEQLKNKLYDLGYFSEEHKKPIPQYPLKIAVLVGDKSAALSDINTAFKRRWPIAKYDIYSVLVQGEGSSKDIISKLLYIDELGYDVIILARGGGSIEDLWSFNDENLAMTIYNLKTFIITGVGHEQDFTIADFVSDLRAPTPTAAVELITPNIKDVKDDINEYTKRLNYLIIDKLHTDNDRLYDLYTDLLRCGDNLKTNPALKLDYLTSRLLNYRSIINNTNNQVGIYKARLTHAFKVNLVNKSNIINTYDIYIKNTIKDKIKNYHHLIHRNEILLEAYSLENTLKRGYSLTYANNKLIKSISELNINDEIKLIYKDGEVLANIKEIKSNG